MLGIALYPLGLAIGFGGQQVLLAVALRQLAPDALFASNLALGRFASGLGMAAGPMLGGFTYDVFGNSLAVMWALSALSGAYVFGFIVVAIFMPRMDRSEPLVSQEYR